MLPVILAAAQAAKDECKQIQDIACGMLASQGFFASTPSSASVHVSQAEQTLQKYKDGVPNKCIYWGCGEDHSWMTKGKITCPRGKDPQVIKNAETAFLTYKASLRRGGSFKSRADGGKKTGKRTIEFKFKDLDKCLQKKMHETMLAMSADIGSTVSMILSSISSTSSRALGAGPKVFMLSVPIFNITPPSLQVLPVPIQAAFPHITLQLGSALGCANCPIICCIVLTAAALTTRNLHFFAVLAKAYPHTVASIHSPKDYSPITLSGIVQQGGSSVTTNLLVGFQFHLPYLTCEGSPTSLVIAAGPGVTVNMILGLPFITQIKMVIDTSNQVAELHAFDTPPFPIDFRCAMCAIPVIDDT
jgi:hypothetical protein